MSSQKGCVVVCVHVLGWGQVVLMSSQNRCVVVCVNVLGWGQVIIKMRFCERKFDLFFEHKFPDVYCISSCIQGGLHEKNRILPTDTDRIVFLYRCTRLQ